MSKVRIEPPTPDQVPTPPGASVQQGRIRGQLASFQFAAARFVHRTAIVAAAEFGRICVGAIASAIDAAEGTMRRQPMPRPERQAIVYGSLAFGAPGVLCTHRDARHGDVGALVFRPGHGAVLDRHSLQVGVELDQQLPLAALLAEIFDDRLAQRVWLAVYIDRLLGQGCKTRRDGCQRKLANVGAIKKRRLRIKCLAKNMRGGLTAHGDDGSALAAKCFQDGSVANFGVVRRDGFRARE